MDALDAEVRRVDEDRWLASRFAPAPVRAALVAIYAFNNEVARTADVVSQAAIGDIRLQWWREAIGELYAGGTVRTHPVLAALSGAMAAAPLSRAHFDALIDARGRELDPQPFADAAAANAYLDATAGSVMRLALEAAGARNVSASFVSHAARAWGYLGLARAQDHWRAHGRDAGTTAADLLLRANAALRAARSAWPALSSEAFPAVGYIALAPAYARAAHAGRSEVPLLSRQLRLVAAAVTGRF